MGSICQEGGDQNGTSQRRGRRSLQAEFREHWKISHLKGPIVVAYSVLTLNDGRHGHGETRSKGPFLLEAVASTGYLDEIDGIPSDKLA